MLVRVWETGLGGGPGGRSPWTQPQWVLPRSRDPSRSHPAPRHLQRAFQPDAGLHVSEEGAASDGQFSQPAHLWPSWGWEMDLGLGCSGQSRVFRLRVSHLSWHRLSSVCVDVHQGGSEPPHPHPRYEQAAHYLASLAVWPCGCHLARHGGAGHSSRGLSAVFCALFVTEA